MPLHPTQRLQSGRYVLLGALNSGGEAEVWRALDTSCGEERALKVWRTADGGADAAARELAIGRRIAHPHVVRVEDAFVEGDHAFAVMELAEGSLAERVATLGPLSPAEALAALAGPLRALAEAHAAGIVHRDVKPHNLLVFGDLAGTFGVDGAAVVKLGDFGIAQLRAEGMTRTRSGTLLGSLPFMSPEQRRDPKRVGPATDVYAMAVTLAWLVTGEAPGDLYLEATIEELRERLRARGVSDVDNALLCDAVARGGALAPEARGTLEAWWQGVGTPAEAGSVPASKRREVGAGGSRPPQRPRVAVRASAGRTPWNARRVWAVAMTALLGGAGVGVAAALRDDVRGVLVTEPEEVRRARELAALPVCADAPTRWELSNAPRDSASPPGKREAGGGRIADVDGDGHPDVVYAHQLDTGFRVFWGDATGRFPRAGQDVDAPRMNMGAVDGVDVADVNADGLSDLLGTATEAQGIVVTLGTGPRTFAAPQLIESGGVPYGVRALDWNGDGILDLVLRTQASSAPVLEWRRGLGGMAFDATERLHVGGQAFEIADVLPATGNELLVADANDLHIYGQTSEARVGEELARIPLPIADVHVLRVVRTDDGLSMFAVSSTLSDTATTLRVRLQPSIDVCTMPMPAAFALDVGYLNDDAIIDLSAVMTCSYCTTSYQVFYGAR